MGSHPNCSSTVQYNVYGTERSELDMVGQIIGVPQGRTSYLGRAALLLATGWDPADVPRELAARSAERSAT